MSNKNLSSVATDVIGAYGITATNVINTCRFGGERLVGIVDQRFADTLNRNATVLSKQVRANLIDNQQRVTGYYVKGLQFGTERAQSVVGVAVDLATKSVNIVADNAGRLDASTKLNALNTINRVALPAAIVVSNLAGRIEEGSSELVRRVSGKAMPAKAVAKRKLTATTRKAAANRKKITKAATTQVSDVVAKTTATRKKATRQVSDAVARTATETSNAARRVARKATAVAEAAA